MNDRGLNDTVRVSYAHRLLAMRGEVENLTAAIRVAESRVLKGGNVVEVREAIAGVDELTLILADLSAQVRHDVETL